MLEVSNLKNQKFALGTTLFGWTLSEEEAFRILDYFHFDLGQRVIDTADSYPQWKSGAVGGETETIIGNWQKSRKIPREDLFICTKFGRKRDAAGFTPNTIHRAIAGSLNRLKLEYLDLVYVHSPENFINPKEVAFSLSELQKEQKIRFIGVSNFDLNLSKSFSSDLESASGSGILAIQNHYNLIERDSKVMPYDDYSKRTNLGMSTEIIPWMQERGIYNICYHGLCRGVLTDYTAKNARVKSNSLHIERTTKYMVGSVIDLLNSLTLISQQLKISVSSIALQWLRQEYERTIPVISCNSIDQLQEASVEVELNYEQYKSLDILNLRQ